MLNLVKIISFFFFLFFYQCYNPIKRKIPDDMVAIKQLGKVVFFVDKTEVTVHDFSNFIQKTKYVTDAEKIGNSIVFTGGQWKIVKKASWIHPIGKANKNAYVAKGNHPVVHVSYNDAIAYAKFVNKRLPTEEEWELISFYVSQELGTTNKKYPWGDQISKGGNWMINIWQGKFPIDNNVKDGFLYTSPVGFFSNSNLLGISDIAGNVWEIVDSNQWTWFNPEREKWYQVLSKKKIMKGGSFMCHASYCHGYYYKNKMTVNPNESYFHVGFRLVMDVDKR